MLKKTLALIAGLLLGIAIISVAASVYLKHKRTGDQYSRHNAVPPQGSEVSPGVHVYAASSLDRIFQDGKTLVPPNFSNEVKITSAGNEYEAFQVVVAAGSETLPNIFLEFSPFVFDGGSNSSIGQLFNSSTSQPAPSFNKIQSVSRSTPPVEQASNEPVVPIINWFVVGYVPTVTPYYPVKFVGPWPDPLVPPPSQNMRRAAAPSDSQSGAGVPPGMDVESGSTQSFWVSVYIPRGGRKGEYRGEVVVKSQDKILKKIPVRFTVYPFTLPQASSLKTAFDFYGHITAKRYPQKANETTVNYQARIEALNQKFLQIMLRYRMCPVLNVDPTNNKELSTVDRLRILGLNNFSIGKRGGTFNNNWPQSDKDVDALLPLYRTYGEMLKLNGLLKDNYIYTWDEGEIGSPIVAKIASMIHRAYPGLKNMVCYHGFWDPEDYPSWGQDIDIWCFNIEDFIESKMRALQKLGIEMWLYISSPAGKSAPNLAIDYDSIDYRMTPWLCWKYDIKGVLYWCVNWWDRVDPFVSAQNTQWENNGNGLLFYPGPDGPLPSIRTELWRDGMEDYEYIQLLLEKLIEIKSRKLVETNRNYCEDAKKLLMVDSSIAKDMFNYNKDANVLFARRRKIAEAIVGADRILKMEEGGAKGE